MRCRSMLLVGPRQMAWRVEDLPPLQPEEILVETSAGAISIGSELPLYCETARSSAPARYPRMTGYESVGTVLACGSAVQRFQRGDRVVAFYGHRTHGVVSEKKAVKVPNAISDPLALLAILTCDVAKGIRKLAPQEDERVVITGAGAIGLLTLFVLKAYGVETVDVVESRPERRTQALQLGAHSALPPEAMKDTHHAYTVGLECSSRNAAFELLQARMAPGGRICVLADGNVEPLVLAPTFHEQELLIVGSSDGWDYQAHAAWYFNVVRENSRGLERIFDYQTTAGDLIATFVGLASGAIAPIKVLVRYGAHHHQGDGRPLSFHE